MFFFVGVFARSRLAQYRFLLAGAGATTNGISSAAARLTVATYRSSRNSTAPTGPSRRTSSARAGYVVPVSCWFGVKSSPLFFYQTDTIGLSGFHPKRRRGPPRLLMVSTASVKTYLTRLDGDVLPSAPKLLSLPLCSIRCRSDLPEGMISTPSRFAVCSSTVPVAGRLLSR